MVIKFFKKTAFVSLVGMIVLTSSLNAAYGDKVPTSEPFEGKVLIDGLDFPWEMVWGPDKQLWVTERSGKNIRTVNPDTGETRILYTVENAFVGIRIGIKS